MELERWRHVERLYHAALEQDESQRAAFLDAACSGDPALRDEVGSLVTYDKRAEQFMEVAALETAVKLLAQEQAPSRRSSEANSALIGKTISHYRIIAELGGGGMGVVYKAEDIRLGRKVALKFLPAGLVRNPTALARFQREARAASALNHPHICTIHEIDEVEGQPCLAMELMEGSTLKYLIKGQPLPVGQLLDMATDIADALEAAHAEGIIHRDIKPANIFVTKRGEAKILDFGLAKFQGAGRGAQGSGNPPSGEGSPRPPGEESAERIEAGDGAPPHDTPTLSIEPDSITNVGAAMGTAAYMSPEQARGEKVDTRTDLFSFGAVLYEMATGQQAFRGATSEEIQDAILTRQATPPQRVNAALDPRLQAIIEKALEKDRELRYQHAADMQAELQRLKRDTDSGRVVAASSDRRAAVGTLPPQKRRRLAIALAGAAVILVAAAIGGTLYFRSRQAMTRLTGKDTIVLSDFDNRTGDRVFDDTLKQGLSVQLEQSPFLELVSERKVNETLKLMGRSASDRLTPEVTQEVCLRTGSKAMLTGSISGLGSQYVIGLKAVNCDTGDVLAEAQEQVAGKEAVLKALDAAAVSLRSKLGESLNSVEKYSAPVEEATTPSLEALKAYSLGVTTESTKGDRESLPFFKRAVNFDPNFAMAYVRMSAVYSNFAEPGRAAENIRKAYALREKVSERERFSIEGNYYFNATGEMEKAAQTLEVWQQTYPRDDQPYSIAGWVSAELGSWEKALEEFREALRLEPNNAINYMNLGWAYMALNRLNEAEAVCKQAEERKLENQSLFEIHYQVAFLKGDAAQMAQRVSAAMSKPGWQEGVLATQADTEGWYGKLKNAHELTGRAMDLAQHNDAHEDAAGYQLGAALREVEAGNREQTRAEAKAALKLAPNRDVLAEAALALARAGDTAGAEEMAVELDKAFPLDTLAQRYWLPAIRAGVALERKDPNRAIELLEVARPIELYTAGVTSTIICPAYLRGEAYLMLRDGNRAEAEFQKFIDHRGLVMNSPLGAVARLGLARAYALQGDTAKARAAYQDFLTLWKDADPDVPILKDAKAEYAKLQ
jgi:serine/threonine protein kinase/Tfp pilus assembly protein PilF